MKTFRSTLLACALFGVCISSQAVHAATFIWDGEGGDNNWGTAQNWQGDTLPVSASDTLIQLGGAAATRSQNISTPFILNRLEFLTSSANEGAINLSGNQLHFAGTNPMVYGNRNATTSVGNAIHIDAGTNLGFHVTTYGITLNGVISGEGGITKQAHAGGITLTNSGNTFSGGIIYQGFTGATSWNHLIVTASGAMGTGLLQINGGATEAWNGTSSHQPGGVIFRGSTSHNNDIRLLANSPIFAELPNSSSTSTDVTLNGDIDGQIHTLYLRGRGQGIINGDYNSTGGLSKLDANIWTLAGTNTYSGATVVSRTAVNEATVNGPIHSTLNVNGSISGTASITINSSAVVSGIGTITTQGNGAGQTLIKAGGFLTPGDASTNKTGTLTLTSQLAFEAGSFWELNISGTSHSTLSLTGALDLTGATLVAGTTFTPTKDSQYWLLNHADSSARTGMFTNFISGAPTGGLYADANGHFELNGVTFAAYTNANFATGALFGGNDILLYAIPEPARGLLLLVAVSASLLTRRRSLI
jgi:autotransporter-associated beta strand protein